jgi:Protein of unknown function (DUF3443)
LRNLFAGLICVSLLLTGCGGGGDAVIGSSTGSSGSGGSTSGGGTSGTAYNVVNAVVDQGPTGLTNSNQVAVNIMYVNVTLCVPGSTTNCQTIDHVQVDTGSQGLRILSSVLNSSLLNALQPVTSNGAPVAECIEFVDGYSWGPVVSADMHIGGSDSATSGEAAPNLPVQIIGTSTYPVPADCASAGGTAENTVAQFGANGIIGVGLFDYDCGTLCAPTTGTTGISNGNFYYTCTTAGCTSALVAETSQVINPVFGLAANSSGVTDNNGVIIELPAVGDSGAATVTGSLVFGIGTQTNNALASTATVLTTDPYYGFVSVNFNSANFPDSYLDSGSNAIYFNDSSIPTCGSSTIAPGFYCPASEESFSASITGVNGQTAAAPFSIAPATTLFANSTYAAFDNLGAPASTASTTTSQTSAQTFGVGLPFFYGRNVYAAMENTDAGGTSGPYFAY